MLKRETSLHPTIELADDLLEGKLSDGDHLLLEKRLQTDKGFEKKFKESLSLILATHASARKAFKDQIAEEMGAYVSSQKGWFGFGKKSDSQ